MARGLPWRTLATDTRALTETGGVKMTVDAATMARALDVATRAALAAGALIRDESNREGGARGEGGHADVDEEAERVIRAMLSEAFPAWGYLGEETGGAPTRDRPWWCVDPNDGTRAFLRGFRGSAVSVALIDGELPVLGVVYAPTAPDDVGDLVTWAEGHPLARNGTVVNREMLPAALTTGVVVAVSQDADDAPVANLDVIAPARYRAVPGIAYRLALVAVGEADAGVSLNTPRDWDFAGGHALVRGAGGDVVGRDGKPVRYGTPPSDNVVGGNVKLAAVIAERASAVQFGGARREHSLARLANGAHIAEAGVLSRAQGCLLGQFAGDSLGSLVEFRSADEIEARYRRGVRLLADGGTFGTIAGQPTDDSEMALALARTLVADGRFDVTRVRDAYVAWMESGPFDIGGTTSRGLRGNPDPVSQANGALMRVSPLGIFGHALAPDDVALIARADAFITHPHPVCVEISGLYAATIAFAIRTGPTPRGAYDFAVDFASRNSLSEIVRETLHAAATRGPADYMDKMGWVLIAFQGAFRALVLGRSLASSVSAIVSSGGDTDTNGAIAGALLGAVHGRDAVPLQWRRSILSCRPVRGAHGVNKPRPWTYWPVDALELAEKLLLAGRPAR